MSILTVIVGAILLIGLLSLLGSVAYGFLSFSPERAAAVMAAEKESGSNTGPNSIPFSVIRKTMLIHTSRLDHHPTYLLQNVGLHMYGWGVMLNPYPSSALSMSWSMQYSLGLCMLTGTSIALAGALMGVKIGRYAVVRSIIENPFQDVLGPDIRVPYVMGTFGLASVGASTASYAVNIIATSQSRFIGTLGGGLSTTMSISSITLGAMFLWRMRSYSSERDHLISEAVRRREGLL
jgi:hypothetical protein